MLKLKPQFLKRNGKKRFAVLSIEDFNRVTEALGDADDFRTLRKARRRNGTRRAFRCRR